MSATVPVFAVGVTDALSGTWPLARVMVFGGVADVAVVACFPQEFRPAVERR